MDFQHSKEKLMAEPDLYKGGLINIHFNTKVFAKWLFISFC